VQIVIALVEEVLAEMRAADSPMHYLVRTPWDRDLFSGRHVEGIDADGSAL
jgi:hypothetical protein